MTSPTSSIKSMFQTQVRNARIGVEQIEAVSTHLAQLMHNFHGNLSGHGWEICVSHEVGAEMILIKPARRGLGVTR
ncbi:hypothetical protein QTL95_26920 [Rhizobium sp. S152]|uniref:hypothetical protein n=1 Tax=Rhizobium sp. S152 TaxID=3055038 RepID=UPI0025A951CA|nr:hypothetical protein [Rhizobium sp. S152]MDM9629521.1 hypothetical protein [Rhizobium sp. S152]